MVEILHWSLDRSKPASSEQGPDCHTDHEEFQTHRIRVADGGQAPGQDPSATVRVLQHLCDLGAQAREAIRQVTQHLEALRHKRGGQLSEWGPPSPYVSTAGTSGSFYGSGAVGAHLHCRNHSQRAIYGKCSGSNPVPAPGWVLRSGPIHHYDHPNQNHLSSFLLVVF